MLQDMRHNQSVDYEHLDEEQNVILEENEEVNLEYQRQVENVSFSTQD